MMALHRMRLLFVAILFGIVWSLNPILYAQDGFADIQNKIVEHNLKNGLKFIVLPRREVPVVSFHTYVDVGSANDERGATGLAHMFEHMAFKGTRSIGTTNYVKEKAALAKV